MEVETDTGPNPDVTTVTTEVVTLQGTPTLSAAAYPYIVFNGQKWDGFATVKPDNAKSFEFADSLKMPVYIGAGRYYTSKQPQGLYFGEGIIHTDFVGEGDTLYEIQLTSIPTKLSAPIERNSLGELDQKLNVALGGRTGAKFQPDTSGTVAVGYRALEMAGLGCDSSVAVGALALAQAVDPKFTEAVGTGAMSDTTWTHRTTCIGASSGKWAGCTDPATNRHDYFLPNDENGDNSFDDDYTILDTHVRRDVVGPYGGVAPNRYVLDDPSDAVAPGSYPDDSLPSSKEHNEYNVFVGRDAGNHNVRGNLNTIVGAHSAKGWNLNRTTFIGANCGTRALIADDCVGVGYRCLYSNVRGQRNTAGGTKAMENNVFGEDNTAWGFGALNALTGYVVGTDKGDPEGSRDRAKNNVAVGHEALGALAYGTGNTAVGTGALDALLHDDDNTALGRDALGALNRGHDNIAVGPDALGALTSSSTVQSNANVGVGRGAADALVLGSGNTAVGTDALGALTGGTSGSVNNTAVARGALAALTSGDDNTAIGANAFQYLQIGSSNAAVGRLAGTVKLGTTPSDLTSATNVTCIGYNAPIQGDNEVALGNSATTVRYYQTAQRSDLRDKTDVRHTSLGLDFIRKLNPVEFRWNYREDYVDEDGTVHKQDGSRARTRFHQGLIAQEVAAAAASLGVDFAGYKDASVKGDADVLSLGYDEFVGPIVRAVQELATRLDAIESK